MARDNMELSSLLPESLLLAMVSFLPSEETTTRACILNKKWLRILQSGDNNINFNENFFVDSTSDEIKQEQRKVFINFITNWIANSTNRDINKFSLKVTNPQTCRDTIERCVAFATQHGVKDLALDFSDPKWDEKDFDDKYALFQLPTHIYQLGSSLESLKLYSCGFLVMPDFLKFDALKEVSLGWIEVTNKTLKQLLSTCGTIESLSLEKCWNLANFDLGDEELGLTRLVVNKCDSKYVTFDAPYLKYFKYSGAVFTSTINVRAIEEVELDFALESKFYKRGNELCQILHDFSNAKVLTVCSYLLQVVPSGDKSERMKSDLNVKHLILKTQMHPYEFCGFALLFNSCTSLEKLTLDISQQVIFKEDYKLPYYIDLKKFWKTRRVFPLCLQNSLKMVEVNGLRATTQELMACCFLMQGKVMEQINIKLWNEDGKTEFRRGRAQLLLEAPKSSKKLQININ